MKKSLKQPSGYLTLRHGSHSPNRNRWFTVLNSMLDLSMASWQCHNQIHQNLRILWGLRGKRGVQRPWRVTSKMVTKKGRLQWYPGFPVTWPGKR
jgi:hypothetical protein